MENEKKTVEPEVVTQEQTSKPPMIGGEQPKPNRTKKKSSAQYRKEAKEKKEKEESHKKRVEAIEGYFEQMDEYLDKREIPEYKLTPLEKNIAVNPLAQIAAEMDIEEKIGPKTLLCTVGCMYGGRLLMQYLNNKGEKENEQSTGRTENEDTRASAKGNGSSAPNVNASTN